MTYTFDLSQCSTKDAVKNWEDGYDYEFKTSDEAIDKVLQKWVAKVHKYYEHYLERSFTKLLKLKMLDPAQKEKIAKNL